MLKRKAFIVYINPNATAIIFYIHRIKKMTKHFNKVMYYARSRMSIFHQEKTKFSGLFKLELRKLI